MDLQKLVDSMNESSAREKSNSHLTYGQLVQALKAAPKGAKYDKRIKGIGSYRGSDIEIAIFSEEEGYHAEKEEFTDYSNYKEKYEEWSKENVVSGQLPETANELGELLESLLGMCFVGYRGGHYTITDWKPIWLCTDGSSSGNTAIVGIDDQLELLTKELD